MVVNHPEFKQKVVPKWNITGYPNYFFGEDKQLYRIDSCDRIHQNKRILKGYSQGYVLKSRFFSLDRLRSLLVRVTD
jgi:hypothetical protein